MARVKRILGLVTSLRRGGNSEALTRLALEAAAGEGARADILFLEDLRVEPCDGCLSCVYGGGGCHKDDDVPWLYDLAADCDGLIIAAPTYLVSPAAQVKALIDRAVARGEGHADRRPIPTATIALAGLEGWDHLAAPVLNQLGMLLGGRIVGSLTAYAAGPGEALLDEDLLERVAELGRAVVKGHTLPPPENVCPVCRLPRSAAALARPCPFCGHDPARPDAPTRFEIPSLAEFVRGWVHPSRDRFLARREEVKAAREALGEDMSLRLDPSGGRGPAGSDVSDGPPRKGGGRGKVPRILGVIASPREGGNSALLARVALGAAASRGAETDVVYLSDLDPGFCDGCLACVYKTSGCPKSGDAAWLFETAAAYDGVVVASPTYFLGPPAPVKALIDHGVMEFPRLGERRPRPAAVICVAGLPGWDYLVRPLTNQLAMLLGGRLLGGMTAYAPGPGEVLLDEEAVRRAVDLGLAVLEDRPLPAPGGVCPVCHLPFDEDAEGGTRSVPTRTCPFCRHDPSRPRDPHRFTVAGLAHHMADWMLPSRERFLAQRERIREVRATRLGFEPQRIRPPARGGAVS